MYTIQAPPGHPGQPAALIACAFVGQAVTIDAPDPDLTGPVLKTGDHTCHGTSEILRYVAAHPAAEGATPLVPEALKGSIEKWLEVAARCEAAALAWVEPFASKADDAARASTRSDVTTALEQAKLELTKPSAFLVGEVVTLADVALAAALAPLFEGVLGKGAQAHFGPVVAWLAACRALPQFEKALGAPSLSSAEGEWVEPSKKEAAGGKKKKGKGSAKESDLSAPETPAAPASAAAAEELDPEKAAKKAAKDAEKAAKLAKFAAKKAAEEAAKAAKDAEKAAGAEDKKAKEKAEAEAKKKAEAEEVASLIAAARSTPKGDKKELPGAMYKAYHPAAVEAGWYEWWEQCGFFKPDPTSTKPPFVIVIPPPNVTGALHIGHALTNSIQDTITRWRRMSGYNTVWVPGTDHAGIATQTVVEKKLQRERGVTRHDLGRDAFLGEVWQWVDQYGHRIHDQLRRLGSSVDWSRCVFTMDDKLSRAVKEAFVRMFEGGCIYRDNRLVNWCCRLKTAVSDIEVDYIDIPKRTLMNVPGYTEAVEFGVLTSFAYPLESGCGGGRWGGGVLTSFAYPLEDGSGEIVVATTRPETMLGDTAVAVHPEDPRYTAMHGKHVVHPVSGRKIPIICDAELVDMSFGTGAVKVTPAHDPNDFATGKRHSLEFINIFDDNGLINAHGGPFEGQPRFKARITVVDFLKEKGLFRGTQDNPMRLGLCSRSKDVIEPVLKPQWWVDCKDMAAKSCQAVRDGTLEIIPKEFEATWFRWLENIRDWCISRQLWWGHRIPAFYVIFEGEDDKASGSPGMPSEDMGRWVTGRTEEEARANAEKKYPGKAFRLVQDEDVLDTWFSSGLFPFSVFGWPEATVDLKAFYPTSLLETGHDILFFWVARMVMMGFQLTGQVPFKQVYLHAMVRDAHGRKMSKSLGNVIDPLHVIEGISLQGLHGTLEGGNLDPKEIERAKSGQKADFPDGIEECGTDALRFALAAYTAQARDINLDIKRVVAYRHWCNKLWNAIKFAMMNLGDNFQAPATLDPAACPPACRWILSRLNSAVGAVVQAMEAYDFSTATQRIYALWQNELCDVFIEVMKPVMAFDESKPELAAAKARTREALWACLDAGLRLLHPFMPFVTEELWQRLPRAPDMVQYQSIMLTPYPAPVASWDDPAAECAMETALAAVGAARKLRNDYGITKQKPHLYIAVTDADKAAQLQSLALEVATLSSSSAVTLLAAGEAAPLGCSVAIVDDSVTVHMLLKGILDPALEIAKLEKKMSELEGRIEQLRKKQGTPAYEKTPDDVKAADADKIAKAEAELAAAVAAADAMKTLLAAS
ncbi:hypothetical protein HYH03_011547 [Edaphochlamys debaryana]|uniref:Valine--tRNA ligase, mitochondrial n=1 Tax=Edaphochlamys debaryana TaxID=47281 RepID=A0A836BUZ2_9CHLO|nr:hypothetical protein HYH03_011547 [Edaphochlamys debaryana]|eukprot:KAG2489910.1 hypothetical protein HYH03_011547 [Edaphochlamys debaryana]